MHFERLGAARPAEDAPERRVGADDAALAVERRDGERRVVEEPREANFGGAQGLLALGAAAAVENQRPRFAELAIGEPRRPMEQPDRHDGAVAPHEVDVDHLGAEIAPCPAAAHQEARAIATHEIGQRQIVGRELREVVAEPIGERRVDVLHAAIGIGREEPRGCVVEIVDRPLQLDERAVLPLAVAGDVLDRPENLRTAALNLRQRAHADTIPVRPRRPRRRAAEPTHQPDVLDHRPPVPRRTRQPVNRLARLGLPGKEPRHADRHAVAEAAGKLAVLRVDVRDLALAIRDHRAIRQAVDDGARQGPRLLARREAEESRRKRKETEDADHREDAEDQQHDVRRDLARERREHHRDDDEEARERNDAPKSGRTARTGNQGLGIAVVFERHLDHVRRRNSRSRWAESAPAPSSSKGRVTRVARRRRCAAFGEKCSFR